jgi:guanylate kinase
MPTSDRVILDLSTAGEQQRIMQEETTTYLTPEGKAKLEAELEDLKTNKRRELAGRLNFASKQGDL